MVLVYLISGMFAGAAAAVAMAMAGGGALAILVTYSLVGSVGLFATAMLHAAIRRDPPELSGQHALTGQETPS